MSKCSLVGGLAKEVETSLYEEETYLGSDAVVAAAVEVAAWEVGVVVGSAPPLPSAGALDDEPESEPPPPDPPVLPQSPSGAAKSPEAPDSTSGPGLGNLTSLLSAVVQEFPTLATMI